MVNNVTDMNAPSLGATIEAILFKDIAPGVPTILFKDIAPNVPSFLPAEFLRKAAANDANIVTPEIKAITPDVSQARYFVSRETDPDNMAPAIEVSATAINDRILTQNVTGEKKTVMVLIGENHAAPTDKVFTIGLLQHFIKMNPEFKIAAGIEYPHDSIEKIATKLFCENIRPEWRGQLSSLDSNGQFSLQAFIGYKPTKTAPVSTNALFKFLLDNQVSTRFNDASRFDKEKNAKVAYLDRRDPETLAIIKKHYPDMVNQRIPSTKNAAGLYVRDAMLAQRSIRHAIESDADVYFQVVGNNHVARAEGTHSYSQGLVKQYQEAGYDVVTIFSGNSLENIDPDAHEDLLNNVIISNTNKKGYLAGQRQSEAIAFKNACQKSSIDVPVVTVEDECDMSLNTMSQAQGFIDKMERFTPTQLKVA